MDTLAPLVLAYLFGSIPFGLIVGKIWASVDVRQHGSGNIGTSNVMRTVGRGAAILVLLLDVVKGTIPVWIAAALGLPPAVIAATAVLAVVGHVWSCFLKFQGGKGIATTLGVVIGLDPLVAVSLVALWALVVLITRYISVASLVAAVFLPILLWAFGNPGIESLGGALISLIAFWRHRANLSRLKAGKEYRFGEKVGVDSR